MEGIICDSAFLFPVIGFKRTCFSFEMEINTIGSQKKDAALRLAFVENMAF